MTIGLEVKLWIKKIDLVPHPANVEGLVNTYTHFPYLSFFSFLPSFLFLIHYFSWWSYLFYIIVLKRYDIFK